jgi:hypothetical protein
MEFANVPLIITCCYVIAEIWKLIFCRHRGLYRFIPMLTVACGGALGALIYLTCPEMIFNASNVYIAIGCGMASGASATGANQILKQLIKGAQPSTDATDASTDTNASISSADKSASDSSSDAEGK